MTFGCIKNLIFDLDGTLIDSSRGVVEATNYALEQIGAQRRSPEEIIPFIGYPLETMFRKFSHKSFSEFWRYFQEKARRVIVESTVPLDGADRTVRELYKQGYRMSIGTTKIRVHIEKILNKLNWREYFICYAGADDVTSVKPAPEVFIKLLDLMKAETDNTLVIGDTANDVIAARRASLPVVAVKSLFGRDGELEVSKPDMIISRVDDILEILDRQE
nr:HAD-IA family hydrolase [candidate division Zixibacteria bacterium]